MKELMNRWNKYLLKEAMKRINIEEERINIARKIHDFLMQPTVNIGDPNDMMIDYDEDGNMYERPFTKQDSTFLYYLYRGFDEDGNIGKDQNISSVNREIDERVRNFISVLTDPEKIVFEEDAPYIIDHLKNRRKKDDPGEYATEYIAKNAPGKFSSPRFATRHRAVFSDTNIHGGNPDFMFKRSPELRNIPQEHHFLFSVENLIGRASNSIGEVDPVVMADVQPLTANQFFANYVEGITEEYRESELNLYRPVHQRDAMGKVRVKLELGALIYFYPNKIEDFLENLASGNISGGIKDGKTDTPLTINNFKNYAKRNVTDIVEYTEKTIKDLRPENFMRLLFLIDGGHLPLEYYSHERTKIESFRKYLDKKNYPPMSHYEIVYPFNPSEVPEEEQTHPDDIGVEASRAFSKFKRHVESMKDKIINNREIVQFDVDSLNKAYKNLPKSKMLDAKLLMAASNISPESVKNAIIKFNKTKGSTESEEEEESFDPFLEAQYILDEVIMMLEDGQGIDQDLVEEYNQYYSSLTKQQKEQLKPQLIKIKQLAQRGGK